MATPATATSKKPSKTCIRSTSPEPMLYLLGAGFRSESEWGLGAVARVRRVRVCYVCSCRRRFLGIVRCRSRREEGGG
jgi:hypothetical protein